MTAKTMRYLVSPYFTLTILTTSTLFGQENNEAERPQDSRGILSYVTYYWPFARQTESPPRTQDPDEKDADGEFNPLPYLEDAAPANDPNGWWPLSIWGSSQEAPAKSAELADHQATETWDLPKIEEKLRQMRKNRTTLGLSTVLDRLYFELQALKRLTQLGERIPPVVAVIGTSNSGASSIFNRVAGIADTSDLAAPISHLERTTKNAHGIFPLVDSNNTPFTRDDMSVFLLEYFSDESIRTTKPMQRYPSDDLKIYWRQDNLPFAILDVPSCTPSDKESCKLIDEYRQAALNLADTVLVPVPYNPESPEFIDLLKSLGKRRIILCFREGMFYEQVEDSILKSLSKKVSVTANIRFGREQVGLWIAKRGYWESLSTEALRKTVVGEGIHRPWNPQTLSKRINQLSVITSAIEQELINHRNSVLKNQQKLMLGSGQIELETPKLVGTALNRLILDVWSSNHLSRYGKGYKWAGYYLRSFFMNAKATILHRERMQEIYRQEKRKHLEAEHAIFRKLLTGIVYALSEMKHRFPPESSVYREIEKASDPVKLIETLNKFEEHHRRAPLFPHKFHVDINNKFLQLKEQHPNIYTALQYADFGSEMSNLAMTSLGVGGLGFILSRTSEASIKMAVSKALSVVMSGGVATTAGGTIAGMAAPWAATLALLALPSIAVAVSSTSDSIKSRALAAVISDVANDYFQWRIKWFLHSIETMHLQGVSLALGEYHNSHTEAMKTLAQFKDQCKIIFAN